MDMREKAWTFVGATLRGAGQVMFQPSALAGAMFLAGILAGSLGFGGEGHIAVFIGALTALVLATACGFLMRAKGCRDGLWGFNAVLVGCAAYTFLSSLMPVWLCLGAALLTIPLKTIFDKLLTLTGISSLTFPFIAATWLLLVAAGLLSVEPYVSESIREPVALSASTLAEGWLKGLSEVFLIDSWITGLLFLTGLLIASRRAAMWAALGSAIGMATAFAIGCPTEEITLGLWGFSPALTAIAVGVVFKPVELDGRRKRLCEKRIGCLLLTICATAGTVLIQKLFIPLLTPAGLPILTLPFCVATWLTVIATKMAKLALAKRRHLSE